METYSNCLDYSVLTSNIPVQRSAMCKVGSDMGVSILSPFLKIILSILTLSASHKYILCYAILVINGSSKDTGTGHLIIVYYNSLCVCVCVCVRACVCVYWWNKTDWNSNRAMMSTLFLNICTYGSGQTPKLLWTKESMFHSNYSWYKTESHLLCHGEFNL